MNHVVDRIVAVIRRLTPPIRFMQARLSPQGYLGLHLTVGALLLVSAAWTFGEFAEEVVEGGPVTQWDEHLARWFSQHSTHSATEAMRWVTRLGSYAWVTSVGCVATVVLAAKRRWYDVLTLWLVLPCGMLVNHALKLAVHRQRPAWSDLVTEPSSYSFPSGHTMAATMLYGFIAVVCVRLFRPWRWRAFAVSGALLLVLVVGFSRIYLGVHYLTDVLAGMAAGIAWLSLCVTGVSTFRRYRQQQR